MVHDEKLERKLQILMSLAADDREGLPPRLRHTGKPGRSARSTSGISARAPG